MGRNFGHERERQKVGDISAAARQISIGWGWLALTSMRELGQAMSQAEKDMGAGMTIWNGRREPMLECSKGYAREREHKPCPEAESLSKE